jgi:hypothetical protein
MSHQSSAQIKTLSAAIADIHIAPAVESEPRSIGELLRPLLLEMRRSRMTGEPMRQEIVDRFAPPAR